MENSEENPEKVSSNINIRPTKDFYKNDNKNDEWRQGLYPAVIFDW